MLATTSPSIHCLHRAIACNRGTGTADIHPRDNTIVYCAGRSLVTLRTNHVTAQKPRDQSNHVTAQKPHDQSNHVTAQKPRDQSNHVTAHKPCDQSNHVTYRQADYLACDGHTKCVTWVRSTDQVAVVGREDGQVSGWDVGNTHTFPICKHASGVVSVSALQVGEVTYVVSCGSDSLVQISTVSQDLSVDVFARITVPRSGFALCSALAMVHGSVVVAVGTDSAVVSLYHLHAGEAHLLTVLAGHEDWIRGLDFRETENGVALASCSQDHYIRLWDMSPVELDTANQAFKMKQKVVQLHEKSYAICLESNLLGHENWVMSVRWMSNGMLLSASMDKTLIVWVQGVDGAWSEQVHVGEVGGNNLGLLGAFSSADSKLIVTHGFQGAFQTWQDAGSWVGTPMPGGHFGPVVDLSWGPSGDYLLSASTDQSVRVWTEWRDSAGQWYEVARSQVHGHDMSCVAAISDECYVSGSEEKVLRVFTATSTFFKNLSSISGSELSGSCDDVIGAHIPALGLSNKAITPGDMTVTLPKSEGLTSVKDYDIPYQVAFAPANLVEPPLEEVLLQNTLWPEQEKLYGHGYEVYTCAASPDNQFVATSCRASQAQFAAVHLWDASTWTKLGELLHHTLTVTRLRFSPDSRLLLSVSRDREWAVWDVTSSCVKLSSSKAHARIIWDCAWLPGNDHGFVTVGRDKKLHVWDAAPGGKSWCLGASRTFHAAVTAVDVSDAGLIVIGFESGEISLLIRSDSELDLRRSGEEAGLELVCSVPRDMCPTLTIATVQWRPGRSGVFAACSEDNSLLLYSVEGLQ